MDRQWLRIDALQAAFRRLGREAFGHAFEKVVPTIGGEHHGLAAFRHPRACLAFEGHVADHLTLAVAGDNRDQFAAFHLRPVTLWREDIAMHIMMAIDRKEAAGDGGRIALFGQSDREVLRCCGGYWRILFRRLGEMNRFDTSQAAVEAHLPAVDASFAARDAGIWP